jgi:nicotinic acid mononucleotide adenylyltransferase
LVDDIEVKNGASIPTYPMMRRLIDSDKYADYTLKFVIGSDLINGLDRWDNFPQLIAEIPFIIFRRPNHTENIKAENLPLSCVYGDNSSECSISSTVVRNRVRQAIIADKNNKNLGILGLVMPCIEEYIRENKLYFD